MIAPLCGVDGKAFVNQLALSEARPVIAFVPDLADDVKGDDRSVHLPRPGQGRQRKLPVTGTFPELIIVVSPKPATSFALAPNKIDDLKTGAPPVSQVRILSMYCLVSRATILRARKLKRCAMDKAPSYPMTIFFSKEDQCWIAAAPALDLAADADCPLVALNELLKAIGSVETCASLSRWQRPATRLVTDGGRKV